MDRIVLTGLQFYGRHGVHAFETEFGQTFQVDVEMDLDLSAAAAGDDLRHTADYGEVFNLVGSIVEGPPVHLIETVAVRVAEQLLRVFTQLSAVTVRVHKPHAPLPGNFTDVFVEVTRHRNHRLS